MTDRKRIPSIDIVRGLVMALMVIDHAREYSAGPGGLSDPMDLTRVTPLLYAMRWISHFCAPVFALLMGVSAALSSGRSSLALRGAILIALEFTLVDWSWTFYPAWPRKFFQVIGALGVGLIVLDGVRRLGRGACLAAGAAILLAHNLFDGVRFADGTAAHYLWSFLHQKNVLPLVGGFEVRTTYPVLPIVGVALVGFGVARWFERGDARAMRRAGLVLCGLFLALRLTNAYGDMGRFTAVPGDWMLTLFSLGNVTKYPLSLQFVCMTLGPAFLLLAWLEGRRAPWLETLGRTPFFFYVAHLYALHALALAAAWLQGFPPESFDFARRFGGIPAGFGFPLWVTIPFALGTTALLWPACGWYASLRRRHPWLL